MRRKPNGLIDWQATLASNLNRLTVEAAELEDQIVKGVIVCRRCGRMRWEHRADDASCQEFTDPAVRKKQTIEKAIELLREVGSLK